MFREMLKSSNALHDWKRTPKIVYFMWFILARLLWPANDMTWPEKYSRLLLVSSSCPSLVFWVILCFGVIISPPLRLGFRFFLQFAVHSFQKKHDVVRVMPSPELSAKTLCVPFWGVLVLRWMHGGRSDTAANANANSDALRNFASEFEPPNLNRREFKGQINRGHRTERLWEGNLPLRGSLRGMGFQRFSEVFRGF